MWDQNENTISDPESPFQSRIDPHLESSDIVVFLFWDRLGTFTQGEFELACRLNKSVFILRKPYLVDDFDLSEEEQKNKNHLITFLKALPEDKFIINKYENISDFKVKLTDNIQHYLKQQAGDDNTRQRITAEPPVYLEKLKITSPIPVNNLFVGRNDEIQSLKKTVDNHKITAIRAIGGIGKTSLAAQFCKMFEHQYTKTIWLPFHGTFQESILSLDVQYGYENKNRQIAFGDILTYLNAIEGEKLVVIDNFDIDASEISQHVNDVMTYLPDYKKLITTRIDLSSYQESISIIHLDTLKRNEAEQLFKQHYTCEIDGSHFSNEELCLFLDKIDCHPLMVVLVAKTLQNNDLTLDMKKILSYINNDISTLHSNKNPLQWHQAEIAISDITSELYKTSTLQENERELLQLLAMICQESIDVRALLSIISPDDIPAFENNINRLSTNGWITKIGRNITCHRILSKIILKDAPLNFEALNSVLQQLAEKTSDNGADDVAKKRVYFQIQRLLLGYILRNNLLNGKENGVDPAMFCQNAIHYSYYSDLSQGDDSNRKNRRKTPDTRLEDKLSFQLLNEAKKQISSHSLDRAHLNERLACLYHQYYKYAESKQLLKESLEIEDLFDGGRNRAKARTLSAMAVQYDAQGKTAKAIEFVKRSYDLYSALVGPNFVENIANCLLYASLCSTLERPDGCKSWMDKAWTIVNHLDLPEWHPVRINLYRNLSKSSRATDLQQALDYSNKALEVVEKLYGDSHPSVAEIEIEIFSMLIDAARFDDAQNSLNRFKEIQFLNFGENATDEFTVQFFQFLLQLNRFKKIDEECLDRMNHIIVCDESAIPAGLKRVYYSYQGLYFQIDGDFRAAIDSFSVALAILRKEEYNFDARQIESLNSNVSALFKEGNRAVMSKLLGEDDAIDLLIRIFECHLAQNDLENAAKTLAESQAEIRNNETVAYELMCREAYLDLHRGQCDAANQKFTTALTRIPDKKRFKILDYIGDCYSEFNRYEQAQHYKSEALKQPESVEVTTRHRAHCNNDLGNLLLAQNKFKESERYYRDSVRLFRQINDLQEILVLGNLSETYFGLGETDRAEACLREAISIGEGREKFDKKELSDLYNKLGLKLLVKERYTESEKFCLKSLELLQGLNDYAEESARATNLSSLYYRQEKYDCMEQYSRQAITVRESVSDSDPEALAGNYYDLGLALYRQGDLEAAKIAWVKSAGLYHGAGDSSGESSSYTYLAQIALQQDDFSVAEQYSRQAIIVREPIPDFDPELLAVNYRDLGFALYRQADVEGAKAALVKSAGLYHAAGDSAGESWSYTYLAQIALQQDDFSAAEQYSRQAVTIQESTTDFDPEALVETKSLLAMSLYRQGKFENCILVGSVSDEKSVAWKIGMRGEYTILRWCEWRFGDPSDGTNAIVHNKDKKKTVVLKNSLGIKEYHFKKGAIGLKISLHYIDDGEKSKIEQGYEKWLSEHSSAR